MDLRAKMAVTTAKIERTWDIDSFMARITTLAAHKRAFRLAYKPHFIQRITQSDRVSFADCEAHKTMQLRLGCSVADAGYHIDTHILFPLWPVYNTTHPSDESQSLFYDIIIFPSLRSVCPNDVLHHHPGDYSEVEGKASVKREINIARSGYPIDPKYIAPHRHLAAFWSEVLRRLSNGPRNFRDPILILAGHDLKLITKESTAGEARARFLNALEDLYDTRQEIMPPQEAWLDFGAEDVPIDVDHDESLTLLRKTSCLESWESHFHCPRGKAPCARPSRFPFMMTNQAASMSVKLTPTNQLRQSGDLAYHKSYNVYKGLFSTAVKKHGPFDNIHLEALGLSQSQLERWATANVHDQAVGRDPDAPNELGARTKAAQIAVYEHAKGRIAGVLSQDRRNFGVRQEYRCTLRLFSRLTLDLDPVVHNLWDSPSGAGEHRNFWVLPTRELNEFVALSTNRWLLFLEALASRSLKGPEGLHVAPEAEQNMSSVLVSALIRLLGLSSGGIEPLRCRSLWLRSWKRRDASRQDLDSLGSDDDFPDESNDGDLPPEREVTGLALRDSLERYGVAWLPREMFNWDPFSSFTRGALRRLALALDLHGFQQIFHATKGIQEKLSRQSLETSLLRQIIKSAPHPIPPEHHVYVIAAELVIRS